MLTWKLDFQHWQRALCEQKIPALAAFVQSPSTPGAMASVDVVIRISSSRSGFRLWPCPCMRIHSQDSISTSVSSGRAPPSRLSASSALSRCCCNCLTLRAEFNCGPLGFHRKIPEESRESWSSQAGEVVSQHRFLHGGPWAVKFSVFLCEMRKYKEIFL